MTDTPQTEIISQADLVATMTTATLEVFSTMLGMEVTAGEILTEHTVSATNTSGVVSIVGIAGVWSGTGGVACSGTLACKLSGHFLMAEYESVNDDVLDAVGEITNMIIGNVKTALEDRLGPMGLSTPTVIFGRNFQTRSARSHEWTVIPFDCGTERIFVQMCIGPNSNASRTVRPGFQLPEVLNF
ncbi:MAG TPA: chemotaxis protein CheX [Bryobacteraceae bacterium]|nr:chemotaxis protein CheX [Bryobacteraceae bacterium]